MTRNRLKNFHRFFEISYEPSRAGDGTITGVMILFHKVRDAAVDRQRMVVGVPGRLTSINDSTALIAGHDAVNEQRNAENRYHSYSHRSPATGNVSPNRFRQVYTLVPPHLPSEETAQDTIERNLKKSLKEIPITGTHWMSLPSFRSLTRKG